MKPETCTVKTGTCVCATCLLSSAKINLICALDRITGGSGTASEADQVNALITLVGAVLKRREDRSE